MSRRGLLLLVLLALLHLDGGPPHRAPGAAAAAPSPLADPEAGALLRESPGRFTPEERALLRERLLAAARDSGVAPGRVAAVAEAMAGANPLLGASEVARIARAVAVYATRYGLEPELVAAVILVESHARPGARSPKGAVGLMQVMPHMFELLRPAGSPTNIETNIEAGCRILAGNIRRLGVEDGVSAYFWGSRIGGDGYLRKVLAARARVRDRVSS